MEWFFAWMLESSLLVLMIFGIRNAFTGKVPHALTYALWLIVLLRFLIPVNFIEAPFSVANVLSQVLPAKEEAMKETAQYAADSPGNALVNSVPVSLTDSSVQSAPGQSGAAEDKAVGEKTVADMEHAAVISADGKTNTVSDSGFSWTKIPWKKMLGALWLSGSMVLALFFFGSNIRLGRKIKRSRVLYGQRGRINIYLLSEWSNPCLYGCFHPAIYLPKELIASGMADEEDVKQMIMHEYVHYQHKDHIWSLFRMIIVSLYWFHPFMWLAASCSKKDAELFCDEATIRRLGEENRFRYGAMLVRLAGDSAWGDFFCSMMPMSRRGKEMKRRICAISRSNAYRKWVLVPLGILLVSAISITSSAGIGPLAGEKKSETEKKQVTDHVDAESLLQLHTSWLGKWEETTGGIFAPGTSGKTETVFYLASTPEEAFRNYIQVFTNAVNTGDTSQMSQVLAADRPVYEQQCNLVGNYFRRGIQEEVKSCSVSSVKNMDNGRVEIKSKEKIQVSYADGSSRLVKQRYRYTCEQVDSETAGSETTVWKITRMKNANQVKKNEKLS